VPTIVAMESKPMESGAKPSELRQDNLWNFLFSDWKGKDKLPIKVVNMQ
jgi:hypothetical protein